MQEEFLELIKNNIGKRKYVFLEKPMEYNGKIHRVSMVFGTCAKEICNFNIINTYSLSHEIRVTRNDGFDCGTFMLFCPTNKSIDTIMGELEQNLNKLVNKSYSDDELIEIQDEHAKNLFKNVDFKAINAKISELKKK